MLLLFAGSSCTRLEKGVHCDGQAVSMDFQQVSQQRALLRELEHERPRGLLSTLMVKSIRMCKKSENKACRELQLFE